MILSIEACGKPSRRGSNLKQNTQAVHRIREKEDDQPA